MRSSGRSRPAIAAAISRVKSTWAIAGSDRKSRTALAERWPSDLRHKSNSRVVKEPAQRDADLSNGIFRPEHEGVFASCGASPRVEHGRAN